jgi:hypothetical protein
VVVVDDQDAARLQRVARFAFGRLRRLDHRRERQSHHELAAGAGAAAAGRPTDGGSPKRKHPIDWMLEISKSPMPFI